MVDEAKDPGGIPKPVFGSHPIGNGTAPRVEVNGGVVEYTGAGEFVLVVAGDVDGSVTPVVLI
jgi:hypothetical protein